MAQPSVASYFHTRKRNAVGEFKSINSTKEVLVNEDSESDQFKAISNAKKNIFCDTNYQEAVFSNKIAAVDTSELHAKVISLKNEVKIASKTARKIQRATKPKKTNEVENQSNIQELFNNMTKVDSSETIIEEKTVIDREELLKTPPSTPTRVNAMDKLQAPVKELNLNQIKNKLTRSSRLAELRASIARFKEKDEKLKEIQAKKPETPESPSLKTFKSIELEVNASPTKVQSPNKAYLSPKKDLSARRNLLNSLTPTKNAISVPPSPKKQLFATEKQSLTLPYKYRSLAEMFRSIDTVCQIMHNRKEAITYRKLKPAVEELLKRNLHEKHLAQIKCIYPNAYKFHQAKLRAFGTKHEQWELLIEPKMDDDTEIMSSDILLKRRRFLFNTLIEKVKTYHREFLLSLDPPMNINSDKITRWHPEFDIERVPDIELSNLPQPPEEEKFTTGKDVLERAKIMFNCNTRMEAALEKLKQAQEKKQAIPEKPKEVTSVLKGIPKSLLEKVRQKQAAKALESMTRSDAKDKEVQIYTRLPEIARLTRNLFVAEKKSVLPIDTVLEMLSNSITSFMMKSDIELHLRTLSKELPTWIVFHEMRNNVFIKILKNADLSLILNKLDKLLKQKEES